MIATLNGFAQGLVDSLAVHAGVPFAGVLPDGTTHRSSPQEPAFTLRFGSDAD